jgi:tRNA pseudouridine55 synthase
MQQFTGPIMQQPPIYSALKIAGIPSYKLAREGKAKPLAPRPITIFSIALVSYQDPLIRFTVRCSKGTYIRTLCADIGESLGMGAHLTSLVRIASGRFRVQDAKTLDEIASMAADGRAEQALISMDTALEDFPAISLTEAESTRVRNGNQIAHTGTAVQSGKERIRLHDPSNRLLALARFEAGSLKPDLVFS